MSLQDIVTVEPGKMGGAPCIRGLRIPVITVARMLRDDYGDTQVLHDYPDLRQTDLDAIRGWLRSHPFRDGAVLSLGADRELAWADDASITD